MNRLLCTIFLLLLSSTCCLAQGENYRYKRNIDGAQKGWHSISLPDDIFGRLSPGLADLRIRGINAQQDTLEMPYLLRTTAGKSTQQEVPFRLINQSSNSQGYFYTLELTEETDLNEIMLHFGNRNFDWRVNLEGSHTQKEWFKVLENYRILSIQNQHTQYSFTSLRFPTIRYHYLRIQIIGSQKPEMMPPGLLKKAQQTGQYKTYASQFRQHEQKKTRHTQLDIELPQVVPISALRLQLQDTLDYYRPLSIQYPADSTQTASGWQYHYRTIHTGTLSSLEQPDFSFPAIRTRKLRLLIRNGQNLPLSMAGVTVSGPQYSLTTRLGGAEQYFLAYGNPLATAPEYDIALFEEKIPQHLAPLTLGKEAPLREDFPTQNPLFGNKLWLWALMLILMVVMGWFTLKMLRTAAPAQDV
ncbi:MAG: DUF3999 family protein [Bacteroidetes bacterium]|nr:DUF3999 family protein [Bacteroidota bacterium]